ncbi:DUF7124 domain-containing protein [Haladaptatus halobius]|uniref:DUF7124 domain-containing protein n=1 Tax=Haladaptatus halobius TaxID=2884875 RepID=UPI001D0BBE47|nr:hypothetical protein [Haladaptatus halobius]
MTDRIDLDDLDAGETDTENTLKPGDWFWREKGDPIDDSESSTAMSNAETTSESDAPTDGASDDSRIADADSTTANTGSNSLPRVPRENEDKPVGVPVESGGAGAGATGTAGGQSDGTPTAADTAASDDRVDAGTSEQSNESTETPSTVGPHGGGVDDMTLAFTYEAAKRLADIRTVAADVAGWADWVGLVGEVPAHIINKFQRDKQVDLDFFNGGGTAPAERLANIDRHSMFFAERMVLVGIEGEDEAIAAAADWEFVPLAEAAEKADWEIAE